MRDFFRKVRADFLLSSILCIALGIVFIIWKGAVVDVLGTALSVIILIVGLIYLCGFFTHITENFMSVLVGILFAAIGIWLLIDPTKMLSLIPILIGVGLLFQGGRGIAESMESKKFGYQRWMVNFVLSVINVVFGIICILFARDIIEAAAVLVGILLIYNGLSNIWIIGCASSAQRNFEKMTRMGEDIIDVDVLEDQE